MNVSQLGIMCLGVSIFVGSASVADGRAINEKGLQYTGGNDQLLNPGQTYDSDGGEVKWDFPGRAINEKGLQFEAQAGVSPVLAPGGDWTVDSFFDITYRIDLSVDGGPDVEHFGNGVAHVVGTAPGGVEPRVFQMEMLSMTMTGQLDAATPFIIRESPTLASLGQSTITSLPGGQFRIDSFFDIWTEMSLDGGNTWTPAADQVPEPASVALLGLGGLAMLRRW